MANFTLTDDATNIASVTMHVGSSGDKSARGHKRLHLAGVEEKDRKSLTIASTDGAKVAASAPVLFDAPAGIWTVDVYAKQKGNAEIQAKVKGATVAVVAVTVLERLELPPASTDAGLLVRLFLAETASPETKKITWTVADATKSMQWIRLVLKNRLANHPEQFMAKGARSLKDIVTARDAGKVQFEGFAKYPTIRADITARIADAFHVANDDSDRRQENYARFVQTALDVAQSPTDVPDPCGPDKFLSSWMTVGSTPGDDSKAFQAVMDNQFFMMERKK